MHVFQSREVEMNMKKLQLDGKHLTADIMAIIHKLGDPEQQELIHGESLVTSHQSVTMEFIVCTVTTRC
jgi:hypothetical protein